MAIHSQDQTPRPVINGQLPNIVPPSPTMAALMKFEEIPVNNYTGIPDVSVQLYNIESMSKDISINVSLKYHPLSIAIDETAPYTGLGWSLFAGGSIARTVKGSPDELYLSNPMKIGILQDNVSDPSGGQNVNRYYQALSLQGNVGNYSDLLGQFGWDCAQNGRMDTQHDIFQYNFMGNSGRFFIKRNQMTGRLEPIKLDNDNAIKIELNYDEESGIGDPYAYLIDFLGFTLYDDLGYKYVFTTKEATTDRNNVSIKSFGPITAPNDILNPVTYMYTSAFHLTKITDSKDALLVNFTYEEMQENTSQTMETSNYISLPLQFIYKVRNPGQNAIYGLLPEYIKSVHQIDIQSQKIKSIEVVNKALITFNNIKGRSDSNINSDAPVLKSMIVENIFNEKVK